MTKDYPPLTEEQRRVLKSREDRYIEACKTGEFVRDDMGHINFDPKHPEVKASLQRMLNAASRHNRIGTMGIRNA